MTSLHGEVYKQKREKLINKNMRSFYVKDHFGQRRSAAQSKHTEASSSSSSSSSSFPVVNFGSDAAASIYEWTNERKIPDLARTHCGFAPRLDNLSELERAFWRVGRHFKSRIKHAGLWHGLLLDLISVGCLQACCTCFGLFLGETCCHLSYSSRGNKTQRMHVPMHVFAG